MVVLQALEKIAMTDKLAIMKILLTAKI